MFQRNSSRPCYYVCLTSLRLVMRTGSQGGINPSEDSLTGENGGKLTSFVDFRRSG